MIHKVETHAQLMELVKSLGQRESLTLAGTIQDPEEVKTMFFKRTDVSDMTPYMILQNKAVEQLNGEFFGIPGRKKIIVAVISKKQNAPEDFLEEYVPDDCREKAREMLKKLLEGNNAE